MTDDDDPMILKEPPKPQRELPKPGMHPAVCCLVTYMGEDVQEGMKDEKTGRMKPDKLVKKIRLSFELAQKLTTGEMAGRQMMQSTKNITLSTFEQSNLSKILVSWIGLKPSELEGFDVRGLYGKQALLNIAHQLTQDGKRTYAKIVSINPPMDGQVVVEPTVHEEPKWLADDRAEMATRVADFLRRQSTGKPASKPVDWSGIPTGGESDEPLPF